MSATRRLARTRAGADARLPTEAEFQRAAFGTPDGAERMLSVGRRDARRLRTASSISRAGIRSRPASHPAGRSAWGVDDLVGNGWEWTSTVFAPFPGFRPMPSYPEYSADFFDGEHFVMKGASPATARELLRPTFRNWFRPRYPVRLRDVPVRRGHDVSIDARSRRLPTTSGTTCTSSPRQLPSRYLYDALGSALFDAICQLPWYGITRAETPAAREPSRRRSSRIFRTSPVIVELGPGNGGKLQTLVEGASEPLIAHLVDVSAGALGARGAHAVRRAQRQRRHASGAVRGRPRRESSRDGSRGRQARTLVLFLGSNIGNFDRAGRRRCCAAFAASLAPGDALLIGADLVKPERDLLLAYDDPLGVTAAFNRNLLLRINRELGGNFDLARVPHRAVWNAACSRMEMFLVSTRAQRVRIEAIGLEFDRCARARRSGPRAPTNTRPRGSSHSSNTRIRVDRAVDRPRGRLRAHTRARDPRPTIHDPRKSPRDVGGVLVLRVRGVVHLAHVVGVMRPASPSSAFRTCG